MNYLIVFIGAGIGGALRHGVNGLGLRLAGQNFPWGTFAINVSGSFLMGLVAGYWMLRSGLSQEARLFLTTGLLGGYTTFSAFSLDAALLWERGEVAQAAAYVAGSVMLSIAALFAALWLVRTVAGPAI